MIQTSLAPALSLDDAEVYANARKALEDGADLLFAHFHEIDDISHQYGPAARQTMKKIREVDGYVHSLAEGFGGRVIIAADHGQHGTEDGYGSHGEFLREDMVVPYLIK